jgi:hypothetical protein
VIFVGKLLVKFLILLVHFVRISRRVIIEKTLFSSLFSFQFLQQLLTDETKTWLRSFSELIHALFRLSYGSGNTAGGTHLKTEAFICLTIKASFNIWLSEAI